MTGLFHDLRFAFRQLHKHTGLSSLVILILGLGIGAGLSIFAFVDAALIRPMPYSNPTRLVAAYESSARMPRGMISYPDYVDWKRSDTAFSSIALWGPWGYTLNTSDGTVQVSGVRVSDNFFRTLGVDPLLGRNFFAGEDSPNNTPAVMLSYTAWQKWLGGRPDVVGQPITLSGTSYTIVGILPQNYYFAPRGLAQFWTTLQASSTNDKRRNFRNFFGLGRLKDGVSIQAAAADIQSIAAQLERQYPEDNRQIGASLQPLSEVVFGDIRPLLLSLLGGAGLLLLIACANVTSLLLARSEGRRQEIAMRSALGATRARLIRQFVMEGSWIVVCSCGLGLVFAHLFIQGLVHLISKDVMFRMPFLKQASLNFHILDCAGLISLLMLVLFSSTTVLHFSFSEIRAVLSEGSRSSSGLEWRRLGSNFVVLELAVATVLLISAGTLGRSLYCLLRVQLGFQPDHLATLTVLAPENLHPSPQQEIALEREVFGRVARLPGVVSVGSGHIPVGDNRPVTWIRLVSRPFYGEHNEVGYRVVSSSFFSTIGARLLHGRYFSEDEDASKPKVVIVNQALAARYFPGEDPIGKKIGNYDLSSVREIIGVVQNIREGALDEEIWPAVYLPFNQAPMSGFDLIVRTAQDPESMLLTLVSSVHRLNPELVTFDEATMDQVINDSESTWLHHSAAWLSGSFAAFAFFLGIIGVYAVIAYSVIRRTHEIGVRMALGAERADVVRMILAQGFVLAITGVGIGCVLSFALAGLLKGLLYGVQANDPLTIALIVAPLIGAAVLASYLPARRAAKVDPMVALRYE